MRALLILLVCFIRIGSAQQRRLRPSVSKLERGEAQPKGPALKLLNVVYRKGIDAILWQEVPAIMETKIKPRSSAHGDDPLLLHFYPRT